ncbi:MAG: hypothetical protein RI923_1420, partial [Pseudomonadota bacterium]
MSTNKLRSFTSRLGTYSQRFWLLILALAVLAFAANFIATNYYSAQENQARAL